MSTTRRQISILLLLMVASVMTLAASGVNAGIPPDHELGVIWARTDLPVLAGEVERTWLWGPTAISDVLDEPYAGGHDGPLQVQYFDKGRLDFPEATAPDSAQSGVLVRALMTGQIESSEGEPLQFEPSDAAIAGDGGDSGALTYRAAARLIDQPATAEGDTLSLRVSADGVVADAPEYERYEITAEQLVTESNHTVASVFWAFLNSEGLVWDGGAYVNEPLFAEPLEAVGTPLTDAYWQTIQVGGVERDVLLQCFELRCLTYTPGNPDGWQVEAANVGAHYYDWRYNQIDIEHPPGAENDDASLPVGHYQTAGGETHDMYLEVAASDFTRACGLMHRESLPYDTGMLFVWEQDVQGGFWNCNTFVPLTLAWIDANGTILGFSEMAAQVQGEPQDVVSYPPPGPYRYVVEANQGWFADHGIEVGDHAELAEAVERGDTGGETLCLQLGLYCGS